MNKYYVSGCKDNGSEIETCDDSEATFWTLYARDEKGLSQGIIDLAFREDAETALAVYVERDALQEQVQKLASENMELVNYIDSDCYVENARTGVYKCAGHGKPVSPATDAVIREAGAKAVESCDDAKRMNWLCSHVVQVRKPLLYGSHEMFYAQCDSDDCQEYHSTLREQVDAAIRAGEQP